MEWNQDEGSHGSDDSPERLDAIRWIQAQMENYGLLSTGLGSVCTRSDFIEGKRIGPKASG